MDARCLLSSLAARFPGAIITFDTTAAKRVDSQAPHDPMPHLSTENWYGWRCHDPREIESWEANLRLLSSETFYDAGRDMLDRMPLCLRLTWRFAPFLVRRQASRYRLNVAKAEPGKVVDCQQVD